jgi:hypothetical protein
MTKAEIAQYLFEIDFANGRPAVLAAIQDLARKNRVKLTKAVKASETVESSPELEKATV